MSECRIGQICDSSALITGALVAPPAKFGDENWQRASELIGSGVYSQCLRLRDDAVNTRRLLPVLAGATAIAATTTLWTGFSTSEAHAAAPSSKKDKPDAGKTPAIIAGVFTLAFASWGAREHWILRNIPAAYAKLNCDEVLRAVNKALPSVHSALRQQFQGLAYCSGAAVLMGDCVPQRSLPSAVVWSNEPMSPRDIAVGVGVVVAGALAVYTGVAEVAAVAELAASWGWVPALAL